MRPPRPRPTGATSRTSRPTPSPFFDADEVTRLLDLLLDPAHQAEEHLIDRGRARDELAAIVEEGGLPLVREALWRMRDPLPDRRRRAQLLLALAKDVPPELLGDLRTSPDPLTSCYPDLRAGAELPPDSIGDGGVLGDAPLLDVAEDVRRRLWPDPEPDEMSWTDEALPEWEANIRHRLLAWWKEVPPADRFLLAEP
jgi:hypothetical protein